MHDLSQTQNQGKQRERPLHHEMNGLRAFNFHSLSNCLNLFFAHIHSSQTLFTISVTVTAVSNWSLLG